MGNCICTPSDSTSTTKNLSSPIPIIPYFPEEKNEIKLELTELDVYKDTTYENTPEFSFDGIHKKIKVLRLIDGDTMDIALEHENTKKIYRHRVRLFGIDTPEKRPSKDDPFREKEIAASIVSRSALDERLKNNNYIILAHFYKPDKYGRLLCTLYDKTGEDINQWMIESGFAYAYFGKTKKKFGT
jgi:endonuclease YncB( thermonuclease family)